MHAAAYLLFCGMWLTIAAMLYLRWCGLVIDDWRYGRRVDWVLIFCGIGLCVAIVAVTVIAGFVCRDWMQSA